MVMWPTNDQAQPQTPTQEMKHVKIKYNEYVTKYYEREVNSPRQIKAQFDINLHHVYRCEVL